MNRFLFIFGARPETIKMAPIGLRMRERVTEGVPIQYRVCVTGQQRGMLDQVLSAFEIEPDCGVSGNAKLTAASLVRLTRHRHIVETGNDSYRSMHIGARAKEGIKSRKKNKRSPSKSHEGPF